MLVPSGASAPAATPPLLSEEYAMQTNGVQIGVFSPVDDFIVPSFEDPRTHDYFPAMDDASTHDELAAADVITACVYGDGSDSVKKPSCDLKDISTSHSSLARTLSSNGDAADTLDDDWLNGLLTPAQFAEAVAVNTQMEVTVMNLHSVEFDVRSRSPSPSPQPIAPLTPPALSPTPFSPASPQAAAYSPASSSSTVVRDERYLKRRQNNNVSASKSRMKRRALEKENAEKVVRLELENTELKAKLEKLETEAKYLRNLMMTFAASAASSGLPLPALPIENNNNAPVAAAPKQSGPARPVAAKPKAR